jgi:hypothetical protein
MLRSAAGTAVESFAYALLKFDFMRGLRDRRCRTGKPPRELVFAEAWADSDFVAALGAAAAEHSSAGLGLHTGKEPVLFGAAAAVGLEGTLRHGERNSCSILVVQVVVQQLPSIPERAGIAKSGTRTNKLAAASHEALEHGDENGIASEISVLHNEWCNQNFSIARA